MKPLLVGRTVCRCVLITLILSVATGCENLEKSDPLARDEQRLNEQREGYFDRLDSAQESRYDRQQRRAEALQKR